MAYTPTEWKDGDIITAERLNKLEAGVQNEQVGPQGPKGDTGGTATLTDDSTVPITVTTATA